MKKIEKVLRGENSYHLLPFLWMRGEAHEVIKEYINKISESGIKAVCLEARPHENFLFDQWWSDLSFILEECEKLNMEIWIFDDKHFPTGYAAGAVEELYPKLRKLFITVESLDFSGPRKQARILLKWLKIGKPNIMSVGTEAKKADGAIDNDGRKVLGVFAARKTNYKEIDEQTIVLLNENVEEDVLYWDMPEGEWSVFVLAATYEGGEAATEGYLNPLMKEATQILIDTVYVPHYEKFKNKFGKVIKGFFSDEPRFGNIKGPDASIGRCEMPLPWKAELEFELADKLGLSVNEVLSKLLLLFIGDSAEAHEVRYQYMDLVSKLYSQNFSNVIGEWCSNRGIEYIGHVIEDNNAHARLGYGAGHFFRSMSGQHMSGIDIVLHQLLPHQNNGFFKSFTSKGWDGEFFTYGLAKLGASLGHLDPRKKGRTMCEVYGAYGWSEGLRLMKWITDHMLVGGVNYFVPHAFSMKKFPDPDCPPHFYAHGNDFEFKCMNVLNEYTNRISSLLSDGKHAGSVGLLYHAEAEWSGSYMLFQKPARVMIENQIEFDIVSLDMIVYDSKIQNSEFLINESSFNTLVIPYAERLPKNLIKRIMTLLDEGVRVIFLDDVPASYSEQDSEISIINELSTRCSICSLQDLPQYLGNEVDRAITDTNVPYLRYYHYSHDDGEIFMLFNEDTYEDLHVNVTFPTKCRLVGYKPMENKIFHMNNEQDQYPIFLEKGETIILFTDESAIQLNETDIIESQRISLKNQPWTIEVWQGLGKPDKAVWEFNSLPELENVPHFRNFSGTLAYKTTFDCDSEKLLLKIEDASEVVSVRLNGYEIGTRISYPYLFMLSKYIKKQNNELEIHVVNNLGRYMKDYLSQYMFLDPLGITGDVILISY